MHQARQVQACTIRGGEGEERRAPVGVMLMSRDGELIGHRLLPRYLDRKGTAALVRVRYMQRLIRTIGRTRLEFDVGDPENEI